MIAYIGQGSDYFRKGDKVSIEKKEHMIFDPYTGDPLSAPLVSFAKGEVIRTSPTLTEVKILEGSLEKVDPEKFTQKQIVAVKQKRSVKAIKKSIRKKNEDFLDDI